MYESCTVINLMCEKDPLNTGEENEGDQEGQGRETIRPQLNY